jgi:dGTPase
MIISREILEQREQELLAPYAVKSAESRGREMKEPEDPYRTCFQRDRDRIIHAKAFRRLRGKTQVFVASYGDHYRSRMTHSMEVAQISRDVARMLGLNEDLAETIALAHDLGHTPFAHAGQEAMHEIMKTFGSRFEHNEQSRRVVDFLEEKHPGHRGLNLSFEVRDGLLKHRTTFDVPEPGDTLMPSIEAQIVNIADEIAYQNHDIDDALRSEILTLKDFKGIALVEEAQKTDKLLISGLMGLMIEDLARHTEKQIAKHKITSVAQVYQTPAYLGCFSPEMEKKGDELKAFLYKNFYQSPGVSEYNKKGQEVIHVLFDKLYKNPKLLPEKLQEVEGGEPLHMIVKDYIAGMTDNFALELYEELK